MLDVALVGVDGLPLQARGAVNLPASPPHPPQPQAAQGRPEWVGRTETPSPYDLTGVGPDARPEQVPKNVEVPPSSLDGDRAVLQTLALIGFGE